MTEKTVDERTAELANILAEMSLRHHLSVYIRSPETSKTMELDASSSSVDTIAAALQGVCNSNSTVIIHDRDAHTVSGLSYKGSKKILYDADKARAVSYLVARETRDDAAVSFVTIDAARKAVT